MSNRWYKDIIVNICYPPTRRVIRCVRTLFIYISYGYGVYWGSSQKFRTIPDDSGRSSDDSGRFRTILRPPSPPREGIFGAPESYFEVPEVHWHLNLIFVLSRYTFLQNFTKLCDAWNLKKCAPVCTGAQFCKNQQSRFQPHLFILI